MQLLNDAEPAQARIVHFGSAGAPAEPVTLIPLLEQELRQIGSVLSRNPSEKRSVRHEWTTSAVGDRLAAAANPAPYTRQPYAPQRRHDGGAVFYLMSTPTDRASAGICPN